MMKKLLKENKGFSLVELLVAILIMAVIAGTAITLFGGVLNSSRVNADMETAESIKRAILTYMNLTNDTDLDCLQISDGDDSSLLITRLGFEVKIENGSTSNKKVTYRVPTNVTGYTAPGAIDNLCDVTDINGTFGPFLDLTKDMNPKQPGMIGWDIDIDSSMQTVTVKASDTDARVTITSGSGGSGGSS